MTLKKLKPPSNRRTFANVWAELDYLCRKISFWLYKKHKAANARPYAKRLASVLKALPPSDGAILREEAFALLHELQGRLDDAIAHREREIALMERLHKEAASPAYAESSRAYMLQGRDAAALRERVAILSGLKSKRSARNGLRCAM